MRSRPHEAAVDQHRAAVRQLQRGHDPVAAAQFGGGLHQRLAVVLIRAGSGHVAVLGIVEAQRPPIAFAWRRRGGRMGPLVDLGDQVALPGQAMHLPGAQGAQACEEDRKRVGLG
ncbi:hypothetical protein G6F22_020052 [Rhizopus arrhizus]|nr:hypothetical protein G6F22_020052 [Rhizopus arrhizus]